MSVYPHTALFIGPSTSVVASGPHIQVFDSQTGSVLHSTAALEGEQKENIVKAGPVRCLDVSQDGAYIAMSGEDKRLKVWRTAGLELLNERELPKKPTDIHFTRDGQTILVSDKFGDIFSYPLHPDPQVAPAASESSETTKKRDSIVSHENPSNGTLILGHTSLLTSFILTEDEKYVVSADRDEHIRVSWFPQGHVIERFCLGHRKYVTAVHIPKFAPSVLVSGGGDPVLKVWDWMSGKRLADIPIMETVEPSIAVKAQKGRRSEEDGEGDAEKPVPRRGRGRKGKGKGKEATEETVTVVNAEELEGEGDVAMEEEKARSEPIEEAKAKPEEAEVGSDSSAEETVLVIRRIASVDVPGQGHFLLFSAVGATSLFYTSFPNDPQALASPPIQAVNLHKPIIDFTVEESGRIWVLADSQRESSVAESKQSAVRLLSWSDNELVEVAEDEQPPLLANLNISLISATPADLKAVDIYSHLSSMPKNVDPEHDPLRRNNIDTLEATTGPENGSSRGSTPQPGKGKATARELTQREAARLKRKQALAAKMQGAAGVVGSVSDAAATEEREAKKVKQDDSVTQAGDVVMTE